MLLLLTCSSRTSCVDGASCDQAAMHIKPLQNMHSCQQCGCRTLECGESGELFCPCQQTQAESLAAKAACSSAVCSAVRDCSTADMLLAVDLSLVIPADPGCTTLPVLIEKELSGLDSSGCSGCGASGLTLLLRPPMLIWPL